MYDHDIVLPELYTYLARHTQHTSSLPIALPPVPENEKTAQETVVTDRRELAKRFNAIDIEKIKADLHTLAKENFKKILNPADPDIEQINNLLSRNPYGSGTVLPLMQCLVKSDSNEKNKNILTRLFTANPQLDFDMAYAARKPLKYFGDKDNVEELKTQRQNLFDKLMMQELIDSDIAYTQLTSVYGNVPYFTHREGKNSHKVFALREEGTTKVHLGWMPMFMGPALACKDGRVMWQDLDGTPGGKKDVLYNNFQDGKCDPTPKTCKPSEVDDDGKPNCKCVGLTSWECDMYEVKNLLAQKEVDGVDFASPERYVTNSVLGLERLQTLVTAMSAQAKVSTAENVKVKSKKVKRMVVHVHCGEGFPMYDKSTIFADGTVSPQEKKQQLPFNKLGPVDEKVGKNFGKEWCGQNPKVCIGKTAKKSTTYEDSLAETKKTWQEAVDKNFGMEKSYFEQFCTDAGEPQNREHAEPAGHKTFQHHNKQGTLFLSPSLPVVRRKAGFHCTESAYPEDHSKKDDPRCHGNEPLHYETARLNIGTLLDNIATIKEKVEVEELNHLKFQLGHASHATWKQAMQMSELGAAADIDLSSNICTGALEWPQTHEGAHARRVGDSVLFITDGSSNARSHATADRLMEKRHEVAQVYAKHAVLRLLLAGVDVTIGSDGIGIEHSGHQQDYDIVKAIVGFWNEFFADKTIKKGDTWETYKTNKEGKVPGTEQPYRQFTDKEAWEEWSNLKEAWTGTLQEKLKKAGKLKEGKLDAEVLLRNQYSQYEWMEGR